MFRQRNRGNKGIYGRIGLADYESRTSEQASKLGNGRMEVRISVLLPTGQTADIALRSVCRQGGVHTSRTAIGYNVLAWELDKGN